MEKLHFKTVIDAAPEKVWEVLWGRDTYPKWTSAFAEGSNVETDWKEGSKVVFGDGKGSGMVSRIAELRPNKYMSFEHLGMLSNGVEDTTSEQVKDWAGSRENYTLNGIDGKTELLIDMDISSDYKDMFSKMWPNALEKVKNLSENN